MKKLMILFGFAFMGFSMNAQVPITKSVQIKQNVKIHHGVSNGSINRIERKRIRVQQVQAKRTLVCAKRDGVITRREKSNIIRQNKQVNRSIRRAKRF